MVYKEINLGERLDVKWRKCRFKYEYKITRK